MVSELVTTSRSTDQSTEVEWLPGPVPAWGVFGWAVPQPDADVSAVVSNYRSGSGITDFGETTHLVSFLSPYVRVIIEWPSPRAVGDTTVVVTDAIRRKAVEIFGGATRVSFEERREEGRTPERFTLVRIDASVRDSDALVAGENQLIDFLVRNHPDAEEGFVLLCHRQPEAQGAL